MGLVLMMCSCGDGDSNEPLEAPEKKEPTKSSSSLGSLSIEKISTGSKMQVQAERVIEAANPDEQLAVIVRVNEESYVPDGINPTVQVSPYLFTARLTSAQLEALDKDDNIDSIEISRELSSEPKKPDRKNR